MARGYPDYEGGKYGLLSESQLAEYEDNLKTVNGLGANKTFGQSALAIYLVASGKTFYVNLIAGACSAAAEADADNNQIFMIEVYAPNVATLQLRMGGNGGGIVIPEQPIKVAGGGTFLAYIYNFSAHTCGLYITARGYEL